LFITWVAGGANKQPLDKNKSLNGTKSKSFKGTGIESATGPAATKKPVKKDAPVKMLQKMDISGEKELHLRTISLNDNKEIKITIKIEHFIII
jgi:hypothetical protein